MARSFGYFMFFHLSPTCTESGIPLLKAFILDDSAKLAVVKIIFQVLYAFHKFISFGSWVAFSDRGPKYLKISFGVQNLNLYVGDTFTRSCMCHCIAQKPYLSQILND